MIYNYKSFKSLCSWNQIYPYLFYLFPKVVVQAKYAYNWKLIINLFLVPFFIARTHARTHARSYHTYQLDMTDFYDEDYDLDTDDDDDEQNDSNASEYADGDDSGNGET